MATIVYQSRPAITSALQAAAKKAGLRIDARHAVCAFSHEASVVSAAIISSETSDADPKHGVDLLFIHASLPKGSIEKISQRRINSGFYVIRVFIDEKKRKGKALLLSTSGREVAALTASFSKTDHTHPGTFAFPVSGHINWCGFGVDYLYSGWLRIEVNVSWC
ncbi:hypothetical protein [Paraburkholderia sp. EG304]|uniref:hypothetical protein n=1 Tax=Paraburkholderia sp. EG304 TaxID=3237015 RepID=UPI0039781789